MDRFLSASLGRPTAIHDEDCSEELFSNDSKKLGWKEDSYEIQSLSASVKAARILGLILDEVYRPRKVSLKIARKIAVKIQDWTETLPALLKWQPDSVPNSDPGVALGQLHLWMMYFHTIILLTRPFLLLHFKRSISHLNSHSSPPSRLSANSPSESRVVESPQFNKYSSACVKSAIHMVHFLQTTRTKGCLPARNPFVMYVYTPLSFHEDHHTNTAIYISNWIFTAALVVFTNSFLPVYENMDNDNLMETVIDLLQYCAEEHVLARRYLTIISAFQETVAESRSLNLVPPKRQDPIENLFPPKYVHSTGGNLGRRQGSQVDFESNIPSSVWDWTTRLPTSGMLDGISGLNSNTGQWGGVDGLVMPTTDDMAESDPSLVTEDMIHFDSLFLLGQNTTMASDDPFPAHIPMYGTSSYI